MLESEKTEDLLLIPKHPEKEWPKILNPRLKIDDTLLGFGSFVNSDLANWIISPAELEFNSQIGQGSSATVFKGIFENQIVAIKVIHLESKNAEKQINDIKQEFAVMTSFLKLQQSSQEHFVKLFGVLTEPSLCLVMQYCGRGSLFHLLQKDNFEITWPLLFSWFKSTVKGIAALHSLKPPIVHRDIKTLNLLITDNYDIKLADFGLSRFFNKLNEAEAATLTKLRGTYCYAAPELYFGASYTPKSDVFSLSIVLWELATKCVTGKYSQPYSEFSFINFDFQIIIQVAKKGTRPTIPNRVPKHISKLINILWSEKADDRPDTTKLLELLSVAESDYLAKTSEWDSLRDSESPLLLEARSVPTLNLQMLAHSNDIHSAPLTPTHKNTLIIEQCEPPKPQRESKNKKPKPTQLASPRRGTKQPSEVLIEVPHKKL
uniref:Protein kinase domain-containing protein n=1 Tax=Arcella intermedia TaxID=1963864 RepID=A0A6B2L4E6_9EUKA